MVGHIHIMIIELLMKLDVILKNVGCTVTKMLDHNSVSIPPKIAVSKFVGYLKGKSALMIHDLHPDMFGRWDKAFWARGYYVGTVGNVTEEAIKKYIAEQEIYAKAEDKPGKSFF